jgi:hypothetical protein
VFRNLDRWDVKPIREKVTPCIAVVLKLIGSWILAQKFLRFHARSEAWSVSPFTTLMLWIWAYLLNGVWEITSIVLLDFQSAIVKSIKLQIFAPIVPNHLLGPLAAKPLDRAPYKSGGRHVSRYGNSGVNGWCDGIHCRHFVVAGKHHLLFFITTNTWL